MNILQITRAAAFSIFIYAGLYHLLVGLRRRPVDRVHLTFALTALAFGFRAGGDLLWNPAAAEGRLADYLYWGHLTLLSYLFGMLFLTWFVTFYTRAKPVIIPIALSFVILLLLWVEQTSPYFFNFVEPPEFVTITLPWGEATTYPLAETSIWADVEWYMLMAMIAYFVFAIIRQYLRGEQRAALLIALGMTIYIGLLVHDILLDYQLINSVYILSQGFVMMIVAMSLTLSSEIIATERALETLNTELEQRVGQRTKELSASNRQLLQEISDREQAEATSQQRVKELSTLHSIAQNMAAITDFPQALNTAAETISHLFRSCFKNSGYRSVEVKVNV